MEFIEYIPLIVFGVITLIFIVWKWVDGFDYMSKNHPDYKGCDFLDEDDKTQIG